MLLKPVRRISLKGVDNGDNNKNNSERKPPAMATKPGTGEESAKENKKVL